MSLTFDELRSANLLRLPQFKNSHGETTHSKPFGMDWSANDWMTALVGEVGEAASIMKKVRRGDLTHAEAFEPLAKELADVQIYLDLLAFRFGIDLGHATINKFNEVSRRVGADVFLDHLKPGVHRDERT